jgi:hypothetical protein
MEDIELNRDWSQPGKLKYAELVVHKEVLLSLLVHNQFCSLINLINFLPNQKIEN